jgi:predicted O-linked N-acetylglucosamine transferase (SPINDLY family)
MTERFHVERLVRLDGCAWCYRPDDALPPPDESPAARGGYVTFGSFNRMAKITPGVAALWARVLGAVPRSRLMVLAAGGEANAPVRRMLEAAGIPAQRLRLVPSGPRAQYLELCRQADLGLDPFPYNGMTTTCDLLWLGVPTVTLAGTSHRGRVGASLMTAVGLDQFVAQSEREYVETAARLAGDVGAMADLRREMPERLAASPLSDGRVLARRVERAYRLMCARAR